MLNQKLKELRRLKGITQEQLAVILGVERSSVGKYESPNKPVVPSHDVLVRMADYFGVSMDELHGRDTKKEPTGITGELNSKEQEMLKRFREAPESLQDLALEALAARQAERTKDPE